jgi:hypothetical protein
MIVNVYKIPAEHRNAIFMTAVCTNSSMVYFAIDTPLVIKGAVFEYPQIWNPDVSDDCVLAITFNCENDIKFSFKLQPNDTLDRILNRNPKCYIGTETIPYGNRYHVTVIPNVNKSDSVIMLPKGIW